MWVAQAFRRVWSQREPSQANGSSLTALDMSLVQVLERAELVSPAVEGRRHGKMLQKSSKSSNTLYLD